MEDHDDERGHAESDEELPAEGGPVAGRSSFST